MIDLDANKNNLESLQRLYFKMLDLADRLGLLGEDGEPLEKFNSHRVIVAIRHINLACISMGAYTRVCKEIVEENFGNKDEYLPEKEGG